MEGTSMKIIKYLIFAFNLVVFIIGLVFIIVGTVIQAAFRDYFAFFGNDVNSASLFIVVIGVICLIVSFFGCCGAFKENHCMIVTFSVSLSIVLVLEIAAFITVFVLRAEVDEYARDKMKDTLPNYQNKGVKAAWDHLQTQLECCGVDTYLDWSDNAEYKANQTVPQSCCINRTRADCAGKVLKTKDVSMIHDDGCADEFIDWTEENILIIGVVTGIFALLQVVGVVLSCILAFNLRKQYQSV